MVGVRDKDDGGETVSEADDVDEPGEGCGYNGGASMTKLSAFLMARYQATAGATLRTLLGDTGTTTTAYKGMWALRAPEGTAIPYITFSFPADRSMASMGTTTLYNEDVLVQFSIWVAEYDLATAYSIRDALIALYDDYTGALTGGGVVKAAIRMRTGAPLQDPDSGYQLVVEYRYVFDET